MIISQQGAAKFTRRGFSFSFLPLDLISLLIEPTRLFLFFSLSAVHEAIGVYLCRLDFFFAFMLGSSLVFVF